jgi:hypothetical protein
MFMRFGTLVRVYTPERRLGDVPEAVEIRRWFSNFS